MVFHFQYALKNSLFNKARVINLGVKNLSDLKVLVAGGAGFIGSHIVDELINSNAVVTILDNFTSSDVSSISCPTDRIQLVRGDINDYSTVEDISKDIDVIIHVAFPAARCDLSLNNQYLDAGIKGTFNLLRASVDNDIDFIYGSSISVYGNQKETPINEKHALDPIITYGATKLAGEVYCRSFQHEFGLKVAILRYSDVYGPRFKRIGAPTAFLIRSLNNETLQIHGDGQQMRDYIYVTDVAKASLLAINDRAYGDIFNIASGESHTIIEVANLANEITGSSAGLEFLSKSNGQKHLENDIRKYVIDITKAKSTIGFKPQVDLKQGLELTKNWILSNQVK